MNRNQKGFVLLTLIIALIVVSAVSAAGYYVYKNKTKQPSSAQQPPLPPDEPMCDDSPCNVAAKPVVYLYPRSKQNVTVRLDYDGILTSTYPDYNYDTKGWRVVASPDGSLVNMADGKEYNYIFWEGKPTNEKYDLSTGFVVRGEDTKAFLQSSLSKLGLTPKEYNEMIVYWLPRLETNKFNLIHFAGQDYTKTAKLTITPTPDSVLRVFMVTKPLNKYKSIQPQEIIPFQRTGFSVVEWGGTQLPL